MTTIDADLEPFAGLFNWEKYLSEAMRRRLALSRLVNSDGQSAALFAFTYARRVGMGELPKSWRTRATTPLHRLRCGRFSRWIANPPGWLVSLTTSRAKDLDGFVVR